MHAPVCVFQVLTTDKDITASMDSLSSATTIKAVVPKIAIVLSPTTVRLILHVVKTLTPEQVYTNSSSHNFGAMLDAQTVQTVRHRLYCSS